MTLQKHRQWGPVRGRKGSINLRWQQRRGEARKAQKSNSLKSNNVRISGGSHVACLKHPAEHTLMYEFLNAVKEASPERDHSRGRNFLRHAGRWRGRRREER